MDISNEYPSWSSSTGQPSTRTTVNDYVSPNTMDSSTAQSMDDKDFIVFAKNVRGLGNNDRLNELIVETETIQDRFDI